jgi:putative transposase
MAFELFDSSSEVWVREGNLPHWYQPGVTYSVTFRAEDSVPQGLLESWYSQRDASFTRQFMEYLDRGFGACVLRRPDFARIVADSLAHFDSERYHLDCYVVMPNHVHLLVCLLGQTEIESLCRSWKKFSATQINRVLGNRGRFWQEESFDHLVRSPQQFDALRIYVAENPIKAKLRAGEFLHYARTSS